MVDCPFSVLSCIWTPTAIENKIQCSGIQSEFHDCIFVLHTYLTLSSQFDFQQTTLTDNYYHFVLDDENESVQAMMMLLDHLSMSPESFSQSSLIPNDNFPAPCWTATSIEGVIQELLTPSSRTTRIHLDPTTDSFWEVDDISGTLDSKSSSAMTRKPGTKKDNVLGSSSGIPYNDRFLRIHNAVDCDH